ncbi:MAG: MotA/TolQ/ExbB proton channel family protein [Verrucomicrobia bacterium]|nr:MotA/TolQ/ExbB proton channel family protein [Verrucomicrobiota bacterium]
MRTRFRGTVALSIIALLVSGTLTAAFAQTGASELPADNNALSWKALWSYGGWLMYVLSAMSMVAGAFVIYFFGVLRETQIAPVPLRRAVVDALRRGVPDEARRACEARPCPYAAITLVALDYQRDATPLDGRMLQDLMEGAGSRQADNIQGQPQYLMDIAVLSPMVGLLGSVFGMMHAFNVVALDASKAKPLLLALGVSQALVCTAFGLLVGIPAMGFYGHFRRRASIMVSALESASAELLTTMLGKKTP